jgi:ERCC4-type nuclease
MSHYLPERYGADVLTAVEGRGRLAIQRKQFPDDLLASLDDGRLARELPLLSQTEYPVLIVEGRPMWTADGHLMQSWNSRWTRAQLRNLLRSVWRVHGVAVETTDDLQDTAAAVLEMEAWFRKSEHLSLRRRPKPVYRDSWGQLQTRHKGTKMLSFFYQGIEGVSVTLADDLVKHFPMPVRLCNASIEDLMSVPNIGQKRAETIYRFLRQE